MTLPDWMDEQEQEPATSDIEVRERPRHAPLKLMEMSDMERKLELQTFGIAFENALEQVAAGVTVESFAAHYLDPMGRPLAHGRFRAWVYRDEKRRNAFYAAKALAAEAIEDELLRISDGLLADGSASLDDTARSQLRIQTRWKLLQVYNRKRYGDVKQVEQTTTTTTLNVTEMTTEDLKRYVLRHAGGEEQAMSMLESPDDNQSDNSDTLDD